MSGGVSEGLAYGHSAQGEDSMARLRFAQTRSLIMSEQDRAGRNGVRSRDTVHALDGALQSDGSLAVPQTARPDGARASC